MTDFVIPAAFMDCARLAVSTEATRHYLNGVFLDPAGYVVALNGPILFAAVVEDLVRLKEPVTIPRAALDLVAKGKGADYYVSEPSADGERWGLARGANETRFAPVDGTFPDWTRIIPSGPAKETPAKSNPTYYATMGKMAVLIAGRGKNSVNAFEVWQDATGPCAFMFGGRTDCLGVVMPVRKSEDDYVRERFLQAPAKP
jgi:hypothetical protein